MTFAMSTEGDSVKSALSEANEKNATDNHTTDESSQDSVDAKESTDKDKPVENNVNAEQNNKPKDGSTEDESDHEDAEKDDEKKEEPKKEDKAESKDEDKEEKNDKTEVDEDKDKAEEGGKKSKADKEKEEAASDKEVEEEEDGDDEEEEEEEEEEKEEKPKKGKKKGVPLLDQPLETSGKRERKNVQRFEEEEPQKVEFEEGAGTALGEIPRVEASITRFKNEDLRFLHKLLFKMANKQTLFKKNIRQFSGFSFEKDSDEFKKKVEQLKKAEVKVLKTTCEILDIAKTGNKDEIVDRILDFLMEPKDSGKPVGGTGRPKRASAVRANNRGYSSHDDYSDDDEKHSSRARRDKGKRANLKDDTSSDEEFKPGDVSDGSEEKPRGVAKRKRGRGKKATSDEEESLSEASSDFSDGPKSKRRASVTKTPTTKKAKTPGRRGRPSKAAAPTPKSTKKRGRKPKNVTSEEEDEEEEEKMEEGSSSEDEPLAKKKTKSSEPPTDDEIKTFIKSVLDGANLEEITMKTVCQRVYDNYPDFDLTARKKFIKSTVKSLIST